MSIPRGRGRGWSAALLLLVLCVACGGGGGERGSDVQVTPASEAPITTASPAVPATPAAPSPPPVFNVSGVRVRVEQVGSGFSQPLFVTGAHDGSGRVFVLEKTGRIRLLDGSVFLDLSDRVTAPSVNSYEREQGLLGLAFHPRFATNGFLYVHYNDRRGNHVISRFGRGASGRGDPASEKVLLRQDQPEVNFNGGMLTFGADGYLYIGLGTGGTKDELQDNAQNPGSLLGKILRIDVDRGEPYGIPADNPFINRQGARPEVWAIGLRNPYRFAFDRATGDLYIGGPGEFKREWIHFYPRGQAGGKNFGWPFFEGDVCRNTPAGCTGANLEKPIITYPTYENGNCVVIGGYVYRGQRSPALNGAYLYGDFCSGRIWIAGRNAAGAWQTAEATTIASLLSSFGEDDAGEVYVTDIGKGVIYRIAATPA